MEIPGRFDPEKQDSVPGPITLLEPQLVGDFLSVPCIHECSIIKQVGHANKAHMVLSALYPVN